MSYICPLLAWWEFVISNDEINNEMMCIGFASIPVVDSQYDKSSQLYMYRGYNGWTYDKGLRTIENPFQFHNPFLRSEADCCIPEVPQRRCDQVQLGPHQPGVLRHHQRHLLRGHVQELAQREILARRSILWEGSISDSKR